MKDYTLILNKVREEGYEAAHLDDLVHHAASSLASEVNNGGLEEQIAFLVEQGYSEKEILYWLKTELP